MSTKYICPKCGSEDLYTNIKINAAIPLNRLASVSKKLLSSSKTRLLFVERDYDFYCLNCCYAASLKEAERRERHA